MHKLQKSACTIFVSLYWMEAVAGTMMVLNELNNYQFDKK